MTTSIQWRRQEQGFAINQVGRGASDENHQHRLRWLARDPHRGGERLAAFGQCKPSPTGDGFDPWALQVLELSGGRIVELTFFLDTATLFPLFGLPDHLEA